MDQMKKIQAVINQLDYDFRQYSTDHFIAYLSKKRGRHIQVVGMQMSHHTSGAYIETPNIDFIFYNNLRNLFMQTHFILHEIGHMVLNHTQHKIVVDDEHLHNIRNLTNLVVFRGHFRIHHQITRSRLMDQEEQEAELFVRLINSQRYIHNRLEEIKRNNNITLIPPFNAQP